MRDIDVRKTVLANGLTVITARKDSDIFSFGAGIKAGSLYEDEDLSGISHMVEHMLFKGTLNRDIDRLSDDIEKLAGDLDIYTSYNETMLTVSVLRDRARDCVEVISDMLMNASFPKREVNLEKKVIIEEIKMEKDDPEDTSYLGLYKAACPNNWYKYHITGTMKSVKSIRSGALMNYYKASYVPGNCGICIISSYTHEEMIDIVEKYFGSWAGECKERKPLAERIMIPGRIESHKKGIAQAHILYGFDTQGLDRTEDVALVLLNRKIGAGANSTLFRELRDNKGYAYNVYSDLDLIKGIRMFYVYAAVSRENIKDTMDIIDDIVLNFANSKSSVDDEWIKLARNVFLTDTTMALESPSHMVEYLLDGELNYGNPMEYKNVLSIMENITAGDVRKVGEKILKNPIVHILLPRS